MKVEQYKRAYAVFMDVVELQVDERERAITEACGDDEELRGWVEALLAAETESSALGGEDSLDVLLGDVANAGPPPLTPGLMLDDRLELIELLGEGGMAEVWKVRHLRLQSTFALKVISRLHPSLLQRFLEEGRLQSRIRHPNVVRVFDTVEVMGRPGLVMEYVPGADLARFLRQTASNIAQLDALAWDILAGVEAIHDAGMVHRDLKPANILLVKVDDRLTAKIADFGLAKSLQSESRPTLTQSGVMIGTPAYMSPEQIGDPRYADARADIWAVGCILYQMITGALPFQGEDNQKIIWQILTGRYGDALTEAHPPRWRAAIAAALQHDPAARPQSCAALRELLGLSARLPEQTITLPADLQPASDPPSAVGELPSPIPPTTPPPPTNLTRPRNQFVGRQEDIHKLRRYFSEGERLVTVLGMGGLGKSRLAKELGLASRRDWLGGVWFVELADARTVEDIWSAMADVFSLHLEQHPAEQIAEALRQRERMLLILDNFEQIIDFAAETVGFLLDETSGVSILTTSRAPLLLGGEQLYALELLEQEQAISLFVDRAQQTRQRTGMATQYAETIAALVEQLDRLPLAIELAAARSRLYTPDKLLSRLSRRFDLLKSRSRELPSRQRTLWAALQWSWEMLSDVEKTALAQCSVFEGGMALVDAVEVLDVGDELVWVEEVLAELIDHSLLISKEIDGRMRLSMLVSVQQFASEKLVDPQPVYLRHLRHYAQRAEDNIEAIIDERENLMAACRRALQVGAFDLLQRCMSAVCEIFFYRGPYLAGAEFLTMVLDQIPEANQQVALYCRAGELFANAGRLDRASQCYENALQLSQRRQDHNAELRVMYGFALLAFKHRDLDTAFERFEQALRNPAIPENPMLEAMSHNGLGVIRQLLGDLEPALTEYLFALEYMRRVGNKEGMVASLANCAVLYAELGDLERAIPMMEESVGILRAQALHPLRCVALNNLAKAYFDDSRIDEAFALLDEAIVLAQKLGNRNDEITSILRYSEFAYHLGRDEESFQHATTALMLAEETGLGRERFRLLWQIGNFHRLWGDHATALTYFNRGLEGTDPNNLTKGHMQFLTGIARVRAAEERFDEAERLLEQVIAFFQRKRMDVQTGINLVRLGEVYRLRGDVPKARTLLMEGEALLQSCKNITFFLAEVFTIRIQLHLDAKEYDLARHAIEEARAIVPTSRVRVMKQIEQLFVTYKRKIAETV